MSTKDQIRRGQMQAHDAAGYESDVIDWAELDDGYGNRVAHGDLSMQRMVEGGVRDATWPTVHNERQVEPGVGQAGYDKDPMMGMGGSMGAGGAGGGFNIGSFVGGIFKGGGAGGKVESPDQAAYPQGRYQPVGSPYPRADEEPIIRAAAQRAALEPYDQSPVMPEYTKNPPYQRWHKRMESLARKHPRLQQRLSAKLARAGPRGRAMLGQLGGMYDQSPHIEPYDEDPFQSEAQRRKFHAMAGRGEISEATVSRWEEETPHKEKLPYLKRRKD